MFFLSIYTRKWQIECYVRDPIMSSNLIFSYSVGPYITDHHIIVFTLSFPKPTHPNIIRLFLKNKPLIKLSRFHQKSPFLPK